MQLCRKRHLYLSGRSVRLREMKCNFCLRELDPELFLWDKRRLRRGTRCKDCRREKARAWRLSKPRYEKEIYQRYKPAIRERHLIRKYGVSLSDYDNMLRSQGGKCAICLKPEAEQFKSVLHVDHCHNTGVVRGLLCRGCNHMLGAISDDVKALYRAISYLEASKSADVASSRKPRRNLSEPSQKAVDWA